MLADFRFHPVGHGLFYSGEIHLSGTKGNEIDAEIEKYKDRCFLFQIPHHGSRNGWRDWFNELPRCELRPVTHRWNCTYNGKPFMTDSENLIDACHMTEASMSALNVRMFAWDGAGDEL